MQTLVGCQFKLVVTFIGFLSVVRNCLGFVPQISDSVKPHCHIVNFREIFNTSCLFLCFANWKPDLNRRIFKFSDFGFLGCRLFSGRVHLSWLPGFLMFPPLTYFRINDWTGECGRWSWGSWWGARGGGVGGVKEGEGGGGDGDGGGGEGGGVKGGGGVGGGGGGVGTPQLV